MMKKYRVAYMLQSFLDSNRKKHWDYIVSRIVCDSANILFFIKSCHAYLLKRRVDKGLSIINYNRKVINRMRTAVQSEYQQSMVEQLKLVRSVFDASYALYHKFESKVQAAITQEVRPPDAGWDADILDYINYFDNKIQNNKRHFHATYDVSDRRWILKWLNDEVTKHMPLKLKMVSGSLKHTILTHSPLDRDELAELTSHTIRNMFRIIEEISSPESLAHPRWSSNISREIKNKESNEDEGRHGEPDQVENKKTSYDELQNTLTATRRVSAKIHLHLDEFVFINLSVLHKETREVSNILNRIKNNKIWTDTQFHLLLDTLNSFNEKYSKELEDAEIFY